MNFEPQKFFVGLIDFFAVLMPGALLTFLIQDHAGPRILGDSYWSLQGAPAWAVFVFSSYLLGNFAFLLGASLDPLYDALRKTTRGATLSDLACGRPLKSWPRRLLSRLLFPRNSERAVQLAVKIKQEYLEVLGDKDSVNAFQWSKARLAIEKPEMLTAVQRLEADSKFFRGFVIVLIPCIAWTLWDKDFWLALTSAILMLLASWRYAERRFKSTEHAYWYVIALEGARHALSPRPPVPRSRQALAAGIVYRMRDGKPSFLFVRSRKKPGWWVLPGGHIDPGETPAYTAVREVNEESGVWARVIEPVPRFGRPAPSDQDEIQFFLMRYEGRSWRHEKDRTPQWYDLASALQLDGFEETKELLQHADRRITEIKKATSS